MDADTLGKRLRLARVEAGLQQTEVARRVGVSRVAVSDWERDVSEPKAENLTALSKLFGKTVAELRYGSGAVSPVPISGNGGGDARSAATPSRVHPQRVRVWLAEFRAELTRAGATDDEITELDRKEAFEAGETLRADTVKWQDHIADLGGA